MPLRLPAEWEPQSAVQLTFPHHDTDWAEALDLVLPCFVYIASVISRFQPVLIVCENEELARSAMRSSNAHPAHLRFVQIPNDDTWSRDHGGITVLEADGSPIVIDFVFNGWGLKFPAYRDNRITARLAEKGIFKAALRPGGIVLEGGGIESDGQGTLLTTAECLLSPNRNPHLSVAQIETHLSQVFGVQRVLWLYHGYLAGDDTDSHIDTLARFCSPDTIAYVKCTDVHDEHFEALHRMETELENFRQANGQPYHLVPLPWPDACYDADGQRLPATYANFLIINGAVLVPTYGVPQDVEALRILEGVFEGRQTVGVDCRTLIEQHGSLHCVTMQYPPGVI
jgi:agmatine deiminase